jgi:hypothetical protein
LKKLIAIVAAMALTFSVGSVAFANPDGGTPVIGADGIVANMVKCAQDARTKYEPGLVVYTTTGSHGDALVDLDGYGTIQVAYNNCLITMFEQFNIGCIATVGKGVSLCHDFDEDIVARQAESARINAFTGRTDTYLFAAGGGGAWETVQVGSLRDTVLRANGSVDAASLALYFLN